MSQTPLRRRSFLHFILGLSGAALIPVKLASAVPPLVAVGLARLLGQIASALALLVTKVAIDAFLKRSESAHEALVLQHPDGFWHITLKVRDEEGKRCTLRFDPKWQGIKYFWVIFKPQTLANQRVAVSLDFDLMQGDQKDPLTPKIGFGHGVAIAGNKKGYFFNERNFNAKALLEVEPNSTICLLEITKDGEAAIKGQLDGDGAKALESLLKKAQDQIRKLVDQAIEDAKKPLA